MKAHDSKIQNSSIQPDEKCKLSSTTEYEINNQPQIPLQSKKSD